MFWDIASPHCQVIFATNCQPERHSKSIWGLFISTLQKFISLIKLGFLNKFCYAFVNYSLNQHIFYISLYQIHVSFFFSHVSFSMLPL